MKLPLLATLALLVSCASAQPVFNRINTTPAGAYSRGICAADVNGDGQQDLLVTNIASNNVTVLINSGSGSFTTFGAVTVGNGPSGLCTGDFNGDGKADFATNNFYSETVTVAFGNGDGRFTSMITLPTLGFPTDITAADLHGAGRTDLVVSSFYSDAVAVYLGDKLGHFNRGVDAPVGLDPEGVATGDVNGDGLADIVTANNGSNNLSILYGRGDGTFSRRVDLAAENAPAGVAVGDLNGDGKADILVTNADSNNLTVLRNGGGGSFFRSTYPTGAAPFGVAVGDFDGDGITDAAVACYGSGTVVVLTGKGGGLLNSAVPTAAGTYPLMLSSQDFDGDGVADVAATCYGDGAVKLFEHFPSVGLSFDPAVCQIGGNSQGTISISKSLPYNVSFKLATNASTCSVPSTVMIPAGSTTVEFTASVVSTATGTGATVTGTFDTIAVSRLLPYLVLTNLTPATATIKAGNTATGTVLLSGPAPAAGAKVVVRSSSPSVLSAPLTVVVPAGDTSASFVINTADVLADTQVTLTATYFRPAKSVFTVKPSKPVLSLKLTRTTTVGGDKFTALVSGKPAPEQDVSITVTCDNTALTVPSSVTMLAGHTSTSFPVLAKAVAANTTATITTAYGISKSSASVTIQPAALASFKSSVTSVKGGTSFSATILLTGQTTASGATIALSSSNPAIVATPASVNIGGGRTGVAVTFKTSGVATATQIVLSATYAGVTKQLPITVNP